MIQDRGEKSVLEQAHKQRATLATFFSCSKRRISRVYDHRGRYVGCWELVFLLLWLGMLNLRYVEDFPKGQSNLRTKISIHSCS